MIHYIEYDPATGEGREIDPFKSPDLVAVVRCLDCVWFTNSSHYGAYCTNFGSPLNDDYDGFCSWGERRQA